VRACVCVRVRACACVRACVRACAHGGGSWETGHGEYLAVFGGGEKDCECTIGFVRLRFHVHNSVTRMVQVMQVLQMDATCTVLCGCGWKGVGVVAQTLPRVLTTPRDATGRHGTHVLSPLPVGVLVADGGADGASEQRHRGRRHGGFHPLSTLPVGVLVAEGGADGTDETDEQRHRGRRHGGFHPHVSPRPFGPWMGLRPMTPLCSGGCHECKADDQGNKAAE
jgi:hypothetical protein